VVALLPLSGRECSTTKASPCRRQWGAALMSLSTVIVAINAQLLEADEMEWGRGTLFVIPGLVGILRQG